MNNALRQKLEEELFQRQKTNARYSIRSFARLLHVSPSALSEILRGKRRVSSKIINRISDRLQLDPTDRQKLIEANRKDTPSYTDNKKQIQLSLDEFRTISNWYHFAIISLIETKDFKSDPEWIALRLGLSVNEITDALDRLTRLRMIYLNPETQQYKVEAVRFFTGENERNIPLLKSHIKTMELAKESILNDSPEKRDFSAMTMAIDPALIPEARKRVRKFTRELTSFLESGNKKEVYKMQISFFPLSHSTEEKEVTSTTIRSYGDF